LDQLAQRLEGDLAAAAVQSAQSEDARDAAESLRIGQELLRQLRGTEATGRLVINLDLLLAQGAGSEQDIVLRDGDRLFIPQSTQEVTVIGEVQFPEFAPSRRHAQARRLPRTRRRPDGAGRQESASTWCGQMVPS
jgi:polysaccharide export outer membrane protein